MNINLNQIIAYVLYIIIVGIVGYGIKVYKRHSKELLQFKEVEEKRSEKLLGQDNYFKAKQIIEDGVYRTEQLAKEIINEKWSAEEKHNTTFQYVSGELQKIGLKLSDEDIYNIIKSTVGYINVNKYKN